MVNCQVRVSGHRTTRFVSLLSAKGNCHDRRECMACQVVYQRHLLYLSSYKTACQRLYTYTIGTHGPAAYSGVAANTITIPCSFILQPKVAHLEPAAFCSTAWPLSFSASVQPGFALFNCFLSSCLALSLAPSLEPDFSLQLLLGALACTFFGAWLLSLQLFLELLLVALARAFFETFHACVDSLHYPFRISMDHKYSLWAMLSKYLWDEYCIIYALTKESNHSNIHCHMQKMRRMRRCHAVRRSMTDRQTKSTLTSLGSCSLTLAPIIITRGM